MALEQKHPVVEYFRANDSKWWPQACTAAKQFLPFLREDYLTSYELSLLQDAGLVPDPEAEVVLWVLLAGMVEYYRRNLVGMYSLRNPSPYPPPLTQLMRELGFAHPEDATLKESMEVFDKLCHAHRQASSITRRREVATRVTTLRRDRPLLLGALKANPHLRLIASSRLTQPTACSEEELARLEQACNEAELYCSAFDRGGSYLHEWYLQLRDELGREELLEALEAIPRDLLRPLINPTDDTTPENQLLLKLAALDRFYVHCEARSGQGERAAA